MRWLGALLLAGGCGSVGLLRVAALKRKIALLEWLCTLLRRVQTELAQRNTPLPDLLEGEGHPALRALGADLRRGMTMSAAARSGLQALSQERGLPESARTLEELASVLGRYDSHTQAAACGHALSQLESQQQALSRELAEKGNLYRTVPLAFGLMAALAVL